MIYKTTVLVELQKIIPGIVVYEAAACRLISDIDAVAFYSI